MSEWMLAHNLMVRRDAVLAAFPGTTVFTVGDLAHQAECSDHNPDARGIVHALDVMTYGDEAKANAVIVWAVGAADLQYVIHNRTIWSRSTGWQAKPYDGTNPHTDHVHISGRHGSVGSNAATCTGYNTTAEAASPAGMEDQMALTQADADLVASTLLGRLLGNSGPVVAVAMQSGYGYAKNASAGTDAIQADTAELKTAVAALTAGVTPPIDLDALAAKVADALAADVHELVGQIATAAVAELGARITS